MISLDDGTEPLHPSFLLLSYRGSWGEDKVVSLAKGDNPEQFMKALFSLERFVFCWWVESSRCRLKHSGIFQEEKCYLS